MARYNEELVKVVEPCEQNHALQQPLNAQMQMMKDARDQATFDSNHLAEIIHGSKAAVFARNDAFARIEKILGTSDMSKLPRCYEGLNHEEEYLEGLKAGKVIMEESFRYGNEIFCTAQIAMLWATRVLLAWIPLAESGKILGAYCQTELGHGTHVAGIETTATFDEKTGQFVVHTPTISSAKFWPGGIGYTCSHAAVMARLIIDSKYYGIHPFLVQIRSLEDYKPLAGIELGDIGAKIAYNGTDNGYAIFNNVRIPRENMLARYATVASDGTYKRAAIREKLMYGGMLNGRFLIIRQAASQLAQAVTIATRYSVVREQGHSPYTEENAIPLPIINFKSQNFRLLTLISKAYANIFAWKSLGASYGEMKKLQAHGDHSTLQHNHILLAGLKAWSTQTAADGAEDARKMCGGHGYMMISGLPDVVQSVTAMATFEGENWVMWQQVALYLMKSLAASEIPAGMAYMTAIDRSRPHHCSSASQYCSAHGSDFLSPPVLLKIFQHRAYRLIHEAQGLLDSSPLAKSVAWNKHMMPLIAAARAHIDVYILSTFTTQVLSLPPSPTHTVLTKLVVLHALTTIIAPNSNDAISFFADGHLSNDQLSDIRDVVDELLETLLPDSIALTDAWGFTDATLASAIGSWDGNVYERIMGWTKQLPMNLNAAANGGVFKEGFEKYIEPLIRAKL